jgi:hypothetical protein
MRLDVSRRKAQYEFRAFAFAAVYADCSMMALGHSLHKRKTQAGA